MAKPFLSICIPAYNRPDKLYSLLKTIDAAGAEEVEVVVIEDVSPRRAEIRNAVISFQKETPYKVVYRENEKNLGYDGNLNQLVRTAQGKWLVFMGDDDEFIPGALDKLIAFLKGHADIVYVLRSYEVVHTRGGVEKFRYYTGNKFFEPGEETYREIFRKSVFISGFTIQREPILPYLINDFGMSGLTQIYWVAELVLKHTSAYFDEPIARQREDNEYRAKEVYWDENKKIVPRPVNLKRSLDFMSNYAKIAKFMDEKHGLHSFSPIMRDLSKYSYPIISIHRDKGVKVFLEYVRELNKLGFNITAYYYIYVASLLIFRRSFCDFGIRMIKGIFGKTPRL